MSKRERIFILYTGGENKRFSVLFFFTTIMYYLYDKEYGNEMSPVFGGIQVVRTEAFAEMAKANGKRSDCLES